MIRVVLEHDRTTWQVSCFAADHDLVFYDKLAASDDRPEEIIWAGRDGGGRLHRIDDPYAGLLYLQIDGDEAVSIAADAEKDLGALTAEILIAAMAGRSDQAISPPSIAALGVLAPAEPDPAFLDTFAWLLDHADAAVRTAAIAAAAYPAWPELIPPIESLAKTDPDDGVRAYAAKAGAALRDAKPRR